MSSSNLKHADLNVSPPSYLTHLSPERSIPYHLPSPDNSPSISPVLTPVNSNPADATTPTTYHTQFAHSSSADGKAAIHADDGQDTLHQHHKYTLTLFENQVAGTLPMFYCDGVVYKPLKSELESVFYRNITQWLPSMQSFIPSYSGIQCLDVQSTDLAAKCNNAWSQQMFLKNKHRITKMPYLRLEDLTSRYRKPCILDVKIGTRHFAPMCKQDKMQRKLKKAWKSTCRDFGVRIGGLQSYDAKEDTYHTLCKHNAAVLDKNAFCAQLVAFFKHMAGAHMMHEVVTKLAALMAILEQETRFRWFSCSLLFTYEGCTDDDDDDGTPQVDLRLIDFTNFVVVEEYLDALKLKHADSQRAKSENDSGGGGTGGEKDQDDVILQLSPELDNMNEPDHGILFGLQSMIKLLTELQTTQNIQPRNDAQWQQFTSALSHSKMALRPFNTSMLAATD